MQLAQRLKGLRDSLDLSVEEMAADCGVTPETLMKYGRYNFYIHMNFLESFVRPNGM